MQEHAYTVEIHDEGGLLWGQVVEEPGCFGTGDTMEELAASIGEALALAGALHPRFENDEELAEGQSVERRLVLC
jgi:predicted RNase H-like HicB family nuclease